MKIKEYIHNREHASMGCGPMSECHVCQATMGTVEEKTGITTLDIRKTIILAIIANIAVELVVRRWLFKSKG